MKSIKPGRGPSFMGGVMSILVGLFGVVWTIVAASMGDITDSSEEPDPLNERFGNPQTTTQQKNDVDNKFCPYCGTPVAGDFEYCNNCGKKLP